MADRVLLSIEDGVATVTLNRPEARNALSSAVIADLDRCLRGLAADNGVRACVLTGAGTAFCAGADLKERAVVGLDENAAITDGIRVCAELLASMPAPVIAAVNGPAYAGGMELAVACDIRLASQTAVFALPEVKLGVFPGAGGPLRLPRLVGRGWARLLVIGGEPVDATEALRIGLVQRVLPGDRLKEEAVALGRRIAGYSPEAVRSAKQLMSAGEEMSYAEGIKLSDSLRVPLNRDARWRAGLKKTIGGDSAKP